MTIHSDHPFATPEPDRDPARRLRGRLGTAVTLWTSGTGAGERAGLTVSSLMVAGGEPGRVLALLDPDSDLADVLADTGRAVLHLLRWPQRGLADAFAYVAPAPGGPFTLGEFLDTGYGPRLAGCDSWAELALEDARTVGWSQLVTCRLERAVLGQETDPLVHRRGRYVAPDAAPPSASGD